jgi:hypothetical protein
MQGPQVNGQPVWGNELGPRFLYQCPVGRWHVAGYDVLENGFDGSYGWLSYSQGRRPYDMESPWQRWNGSFHADDPAVTVAPVTSSLAKILLGELNTLDITASNRVV